MTIHKTTQHSLMPADAELHAYVDGELDTARRAQIDALLPTHPDLARQIDAIRAAAQQLRASLPAPSPADTPARLDPFRIRRTLRDRTQRRMAVAASLVMALGIGGVGGWQTRELAMRQNYLPMADAVQAYRMFAASEGPQVVDVSATDPRALQSWLDRHFVQPAPLPDFTAYGFRPAGGRLMPTEQGTAAMVLYRNDQGQTIVYYVRPPGNLLRFGNGNRQDGNLLAQYWRQGRYSYAVVSPTDTPVTRTLQQAIEPSRRDAT